MPEDSPLRVDMTLELDPEFVAANSTEDCLKLFDFELACQVIGLRRSVLWCIMDAKKDGGHAN